MKVFQLVRQASELFLSHWREALAGVILFICVLLLVSCSTPTPTSYSAPIAPNVAAEYANQTAQAAQNQAAQYNAQASATSQAQTAIAFAPLAQMTQAAAELQIQNLYAQATTTSAAATQTAYAVQQAYIAQTTSTAGAATQQAMITQQAITMQVERDQLAIERERDKNLWEARKEMLYTIFFWVIVAVFAIVVIRRLSIVSQKIDERGRIIPVVNVLEGTIVDIEKSANGMVGMSKKFLAQLPRITAERQAQVTALAQRVDMATRAKLPLSILKKIDELENREQLLLPAPEQAAFSQMDAANLPLPPWEFINDWKGEARPLGFGVKGLITAQAASPHLLISGKTGTGKTGFMLRTQVTASLAKGYQVINLGFSESGFGVFAGHPNYHAVKLEQASDIIAFLESVYRELKDRKRIIGGESIEWDHWPNGNPPRPFVDLIIDELGNIAEDIYVSEETKSEGLARSKQLWRWLSMIANEGRKVGIRFIAALQDPTAKSVDLRFRRNCTLVSFQQGDASQSSAFLGTTGAELLSVGHFMARTDNLVIGGGFAPTDDEIQEYLRTHATDQTPPPTWIDISLIPPINLPAPTQDLVEGPAEVRAQKPVESVGDWLRTLDDKQARVIDLHIDGGKSDTRIALEVYGYANNTSLPKVRSLIAEYDRRSGPTTTTTTTTAQNSPNLGPVPA